MAWRSRPGARLAVGDRVRSGNVVSTVSRFEDRGAWVAVVLERPGLVGEAVVRFDARQPWRVWED